MGALQPLLGSNNFQAGARSRALSHASVSYSDTWSTYNNQAGMAGITDISAGFYYESKFNIDKLTFQACSVILPTGYGSFGLSIYQFGRSTYKENKLALAYAKKLSNKFQAGIQMDYFSHLLPENDKPAEIATFEAGLIFKVTNKLFLATHIFNPVSKGYNYPAGKITMPTVLRTGGHYIFDESLLVAFEAEKDEEHPLKIMAGLEYMPVESLAFRIGFSEKPFKYTAGFGFRLSKFTADLGFGYHGNLGITPSISVQVSL
ncbi:MAG TPA: hypothetical protein VFD91_15770 [Mariniphaga sp.]|nr:hypothetical protein [Mariniphaga sp.]